MLANVCLAIVGPDSRGVQLDSQFDSYELGPLVFDAVRLYAALAALVIAGLTRVRQQSTYRHVQHATSIAALNNAVRRDILRAARLAEPALAAFDNPRNTAEN